MTDKNQAALDAFKRLCLLMPGELPYDKGHQSNLDMVLVREALQSLSSPSAGVDVARALQNIEWAQAAVGAGGHGDNCYVAEGEHDRCICGMETILEFLTDAEEALQSLPAMREAPEEMTVEQFIDYLPRERGGGIYIDSEIVAGWATDYPHGLRIIEPPKGERP